MTESSDEDSHSQSTRSPDETESTTSSAPLSGLKVVLKLKRSASGGKAGQSPSKRGRQTGPKSATKEPPKEERTTPDSAAGSEEAETTSVPMASPTGRGRGRGRGRGGTRGRGRGRGGSRLTLPRKRRKPAVESAATPEQNEAGEEGESGPEESGEDNESGEEAAAEAPPEEQKTPEFVAPLPITPNETGKHRKSGPGGFSQDNWLTKVLTYLHRYLQRKDTQGFFADPVDDDVAPGYSQIISQPMDFSTILAKIKARRYANIIDFKRDFKLMCANAMRYNAEETIYYKAAKRLLQLGLKLLSKERLTSLRTTLAPMAQLTIAEMGFDYTKVKVSEQEADETQRLTQEDGMEISPPIPPQPVAPPREERELSASEIADLARSSHQKMLDQAESQGRRPAQLGYLRKTADKSISFVFVPPDGGSGMLSETERVVNLGEYTSPIHFGQPNLHGVNSFKELPQNEIRPISFHDYGSFCSFAPVYDSTFATLSPEDSALLLSAYGTDTGVMYASSIKRFVRKAGRVANLIADGRLDSATGGTHQASGRGVIESKLDEIDRLNKASAEQGLSADNLLSSIGTKLEAIHDLQTDRLSQPPTEHLRLTQGPSPRETELANSAVKEIADLVQTVRPGDLIEDPMLVRSLLTTFAI